MTDERVLEVHKMPRDKFYEKNSQVYEERGKGVLYVYQSEDGTVLGDPQVGAQLASTSYHRA
ncbi:MAG: hypothetical protein ABI241_07130 [Bacteroidia bacterium]